MNTTFGVGVVRPFIGYLSSVLPMTSQAWNASTPNSISVSGEVSALLFLAQNGRTTRTRFAVNA